MANPPSPKFQSDVFKFVSVRPPQKIDSETEDKIIISDSRPADQSEILNMLDKVIPVIPVRLVPVPARGHALPERNAEDAKALFKKIVNNVQSIVSKRKYELQYPANEPLFQKLNDVGKIVKNYFSTYDKEKLSKDLVKALNLNKDEKMTFAQKITEFVTKNPKLNNIKEGLWERLYSFHILNRVKPCYLEGLIDGLRYIHMIDYLAENGLPSEVSDLKLIFNAIPILPDKVHKLSNDPVTFSSKLLIVSQSFPTAPNFRYIGVGDLLVVRQTLQRYVMGEIADIENVLLGETKQRNHRRLERTEEIVFKENETIEIKEKDNQTTERFELKHESDKTIKSDMDLKTGVTVSGKFGPVEMTANASFALSSSTDESTKNANNYAKDVVDRSLSSIQSRVKEQRTRKTLLEIEEINNHGFINPAQSGNTNISGIYRWVDKHYEAQVYNYGVRPMFEFIIPEPAAFYIFSHSPENRPQEKLNIDPPPDFIFKGKPIIADLIDRTNYLELASIFRAAGVTSPLDEKTIIGYSCDVPLAGEDGENFTIITKSEKQALIITPGYKADFLNYILVPSHQDDWWGVLNIGSYTFLKQDGYSITGSLQMSGETGILPMSFICGRIETLALSISLTCLLTEEKFNEWKLKTFDTIAIAYHNWKSDYDTKSYAVKNEQAGENIIKGHNPLINRATEKEELKRACISILADQWYEQFKAMLPPLDPKALLVGAPPLLIFPKLI